MTMIQNWLANPKTSAGGFASIITGILRIVNAIRAGEFSDLPLEGPIGLIIVGFALLAAGDASKSKKDTQAVDAKVDQTASAVLHGNTDFLPKPTMPTAPKDG